MKLPNPTLKRLIEGNRRYVSAKTSMDTSEYRRTKVAFKQKPFAAILSCADSRVPPELIFDQGLGNLFVVRTAGAILDKAVLGSLEFGVSELRTSVLLVLGHSRCGAVKFAMEVEEGIRNADADTAYLVDALKPSMGITQPHDKDKWNQTTRIHIQTVVEQLKHSPVLELEVQAGSLEIVGGWYDLDTGIVEMLPG
jgi:carbonic anhydrase